MSSITTLTTVCQKKQLALLKTDSDQAALWNSHPIHLSASDASTFNVSRVVSILANESKSPSELAGISEDASCSVIRRMDRIYHESIANYKVRLNIAKTEDLLAINRNSRYWIYERWQWFGVSWFIQRFADWFITQSQYEHDARAHRFACLIAIDTLEDERLKKIKAQIEDAFTVLIQDIDRLATSDQVDTDKLKEVKQLKDVYRAYFSCLPSAHEEGLRRILPLEQRFLREGV